MDIVNKKIKEKLYIPNKAKSLIDSRKTCFIDIETTGFSRQRDSIVLIGMLYYEDDYIVINQFFADTPKDEKLILSAFKDVISKFDCFISYNGDAFDIPFLNHKYSNYNYDFQINKNNSIDLIKIVRKNKEKLGIADCKLKTVEKSLNLFREDKITGRESVQFYRQFLKTKSPVLKKLILNHNYDDIYFLPKVLKLFDKIDEKMNCDFSIPINDNIVRMKFNLDDMLVKGDVLSINGLTSRTNIAKQVFYGTNYTFVLDTFKGVFELKLEVGNGCLSNGRKCLYVNKDDFPLNISVEDATNYTLPENIVIIKDEKILVYDNIGALIKDIVSEIFISSIAPTVNSK